MGRHLGELLVAEGRISEAVLTRALEIQETQARGWKLGAILLRWGLLPERALLDALSVLHRCPAVDWETLSSAKREVVDLLTPAQSARLHAVPYAMDRKSVRVAFLNPSNLAAIDEVQAITGKRVIPAVTTEVRLLQAQQRFYHQPLERDIWTIVQKIERPAPAPTPQTAARVLPPPPPVLEPLWIEEESEERDLVSAQPTLSAPKPDFEEGLVEDLVEPAAELEIEPLPGAALPDLAVEPEPLEERGNSVAAFAPKTPPLEAFQAFMEGRPLTDLLGDRSNLFSDDTPLDEFIEQALAFYEACPAFRSPPSTLDDGSAEDLGAFVEAHPARGSNLDSTHPSSSPRPSEFDPELSP